MELANENQSQSRDNLKDLSCLYEITKNLASAVNMRSCLEKTVEILAVEKEMESGTVTIINPITGHLEIEVAHGIGDEAKKKGTYRLGEGITGRVVATGRPIIVPQIDEEPDFLNKTGTRGDGRKGKGSFICVPIHMGEQVIGALSVDRSYADSFGVQSEADLRFLTIVSGLIARTVHRIQAVNREKESLRQENKKLRRELSSKNRIEEIVGNSSRMEEVFAMVHKVADSEATVLLRGESGTGKTMVARALHHNSGRREEPFIVVNCSALPETLLESELFGHEKGAFTGANTMRKGRFEVADGGTIFLDEIGEIPLALQSKLLRVLQEKSFERVGGSRTLNVNVRIISASNKELKEEVVKGNFREDLYYRLNVIHVVLPPLRERMDDLPAIADYFVKSAAKKLGKDDLELSTDALRLLLTLPWDGNIRELENTIERAAILCNNNRIEPEDVQPESTNDTGQSDWTSEVDLFQLIPESIGLNEVLYAIEEKMLLHALDETGYVQARAAEKLGITKSLLQYKMKKYRIKKK